MENNFIQMAASAGHAVAYTIGEICKLIIYCVQLYFTSGENTFRISFLMSAQAKYFFDDFLSADF